MREKRSNKKYRIVLEWFLAAMLALGIFYYLFQFCYVLVKIDSHHMAHTLLKGDVVLVDKTKLGGRYPITPLSIPFTRIYSTTPSLEPKRLNGGKLEFKDLLVFNDPLEDSIPLDKRRLIYSRLIGLPGDTVKIHYGRLYRNNIIVRRDSSMLFSYKVNFNDSDSAIYTLQKHQAFAAATTGDSTEWIVNCPQNTALQLAAEKDIDGFDVVLFTDPLQDDLFPGSIFAPYALDDYGPLWIPEKGDSVLIGMDNFPLYKRIIKEETKGYTYSNDSLFFNGKYDPWYTFKQNYYFVLGDNRHHSYDSRNFGFLGEIAILGVVDHIWHSDPPLTEVIIYE